MPHPADKSEQRALEIGRRQSLFREVNEQIEALAGDFDLLDQISIICECASAECHEQIALTETEYEDLRRIPTHFAVLPGHDIADVERIVEKNDRYVVVEKVGESAVAAIKLDPRRRAR
jgi:SpoU rRNA methylase family enzyme